MSRWTIRLVIGIAFSSVFLLLLAGVTQAQESPQTPPTLTPSVIDSMIPGGQVKPSGLPDCRECHWEVYITWEESAHGQGLSCGQCHLGNQRDNHARTGHGAQGSPQQCMGCHTTGYDPKNDTWSEPNVHCTACHNPPNPNHPKEPMPTDRSEALCGSCHIQARFEWQNSQHGQAGVTCVNCHNQHRTSLKAGRDNISEQCATCHETREDGFSSSIHATHGLSCGDCHLAPLENQIGEGNAKRNHTFTVDIGVCMNCHKTQMHVKSVASGAQVTPVLATAEPAVLLQGGVIDSLSSASNQKVCAEPTPASPAGAIAVLSFFGLVSVVAIFPKIGKLSLRRQRKDR
jgi:hypothetical protein